MAHSTSGRGEAGADGSHVAEPADDSKHAREQLPRRLGNLAQRLAARGFIDVDERGEESGELVADAAGDAQDELLQWQGVQMCLPGIQNLQRVHPRRDVGSGGGGAERERDC